MNTLNPQTFREKARRFTGRQIIVWGGPRIRIWLSKWSLTSALRKIRTIDLNLEKSVRPSVHELIERSFPFLELELWQSGLKKKGPSLTIGTRNF